MTKFLTYCKSTVRLHLYAVMKCGVPNTVLPEKYPTFMQVRGKLSLSFLGGQRVLFRLKLQHVSLNHVLFLERNICLWWPQLCLTCSKLKAVFQWLKQFFLHWVKILQHCPKIFDNQLFSNNMATLTVFNVSFCLQDFYRESF